MSKDSLCEDHIQKLLERFWGQCKDRHAYLKSACTVVLQQLKGEGTSTLNAEEKANLLFYPLKLAVETREESFVCGALDGIQKVLSHELITKDTKYAPPSVPEPPKKKSFFNLGNAPDSNPPSPTPKPDSEAGEPLINTLVFSVCLNIQNPAEDIHNQIVRTLLTAVSNAECGIHGKVLLFVIRANYDIFRMARSPPVQTSSRASLSQIIGLVLSRMESADEGASIPFAENNDDDESNMVFTSQEEEDCFLVLRRLCKVSMSTLDTSGAADINEIRAKQLSLQLTQHFINSAGPILKSKSTFILSLRKYVCASLMQNCILTIPEASKVAFDILAQITVEFRHVLKQQVKVFFQNILFPVIESQNAPFTQKEMVLVALNKFASNEQAILDLFVNFDCVIGNPQIFEQFVNSISKAVRMSHSVPNWITPKQSELLKIRAITTIKSLVKSLVEFAQAHQLPTDQEDTPCDPQSPTVLANAPQVEDSEIEKMRKSKKTHEAVIEMFAKKPVNGFDLAIKVGMLADKNPPTVAEFLASTPGLDKVKIGEFLAKNEPFAKDCLREFIELHDFTGHDIDEALRLFMGKFKMGGEAQTVERTMELFAECYCEQNPGVFSSSGTAFILSFSIMMLNTDAHSIHVKNKMTLEEFFRNNTGIDDGKDLSQRFLEDIYRRVKANEIKLDGEDAKKQTSAKAASHTVEMTDMDKIFLSLEKKRQLQTKAEFSTLQTESLQQLQSLSQAQGGTLEPHHHADSADIVQPMWEAIWTAVLPALSVPMEETDEPVVIDACLEGIDEAMKLSCMFSTSTEREAFITTLATFTHLTSYREIHYKSVRAIQTILAIADREGDFLEGSWYEVLKCISLLDRLQLLSTDRGGPPLLTAQAYETKRMERFNADMISQYIDLVTIDRIISKSKNLGGRAVVFMVEQLCRVSAEELQEQPRPRTYSLQKLVEVTELNIGRMRYVWSQMWTCLSAHFTSVGLVDQELTAMYVVDSLRQLAMKFLERNELGNFNFQRDFLKPFEVIVAQSKRQKIRELIVASLQQMVEARAMNIMSGWKIVINTIARCASCREMPVVSSGFDLLKLISERYVQYVITPELFCETVIAWSYFGENKQSRDIALTAIDYINLCAAYIVDGIPRSGLSSAVSGETLTECLKRTLETSSVLHEKAPLRNDSRTWFAIFAALSSVTNGAVYETRMAAIDAMFDLLTAYGSMFDSKIWSGIIGRSVFPVFDKLFSDIVECNNSDETDGELYSGLLRLLDRTLKGCLSLQNNFFEMLSSMISDFANIMLSCGKKNDRKVSQLGLGALGNMITAAPTEHRPFTKEEWDILCERIKCAGNSWLMIADGVLKSDAEGMSNIAAAEVNARVLSHLLRTLRGCMLVESVPVYFFEPFQQLFTDCYRLSTTFFSDSLCSHHIEEFPSLQPVLLALEKEASDCYIEVATKTQDDNQLTSWVRWVLSRFIALDKLDNAIAEAERTVLLDILINVIGATLQLPDDRFRSLTASIYEDLCSLIRCCDRTLSAVLCSVFMRIGAKATVAPIVTPAAAVEEGAQQLANDSVVSTESNHADPEDTEGPKKKRKNRKKNNQ